MIFIFSVQTVVFLFLLVTKKQDLENLKIEWCNYLWQIFLRFSIFWRYVVAIYFWKMQKFTFSQFGGWYLWTRPFMSLLILTLLKNSFTQHAPSPFKNFVSSPFFFPFHHLLFNIDHHQLSIHLIQHIDMAASGRFLGHSKLLKLLSK